MTSTVIEQCRSLELKDPDVTAHGQLAYDIGMK